MFDFKHYVPIIRWKAGERAALRELYDDDRTGLTPLIEIPPDIIEKAIDKMSIGDFASHLRIQIAESWGRRLAFVDLSHLIGRITSNQQNDFIQAFYAQARKLGLILVPVTYLNRTYVANVHSGNTGIEKETCLRLIPEDVESERLVHDITKWITRYETDPSKVHLIVDLRAIGPLNPSYLKFYSNLPLLDDWNTVTVVGGSFPIDLQELSVGEHLLQRLEWHSWKQLALARVRRTPTFGDYATLHPFLRAPFPGMNVSASIRYTTDDDWLVMRGEGLRNKNGAGHAQYPANAQLLMDRPEFCGRGFSFGDNYIYERSRNRDKPGIPKNWVTVGVNHHLTFVVRQIENLFELPRARRPYVPADISLPFVSESSAGRSRRYRKAPKSSPKK